MKWIWLFSNAVCWACFMFVAFVHNLLYKNVTIEAAKAQFSDPSALNQAALDLSKSGETMFGMFMLVPMAFTVVTSVFFLLRFKKENS